MHQPVVTNSPRVEAIARTVHMAVWCTIVRESRTEAISLTKSSKKGGSLSGYGHILSWMKKPKISQEKLGEKIEEKEYN